MNTARIFTLSSFFCFALSTSLLGQTTNYYCTNAVQLNPGINSFGTTAAPVNSGATDGCAANIAHGVWFTVTPAINQRVILSTAGSSFPAQMAIYTGSCGALSSFTCVSPGYFNGQAGISFASASNVTYHILAGGYLGQSAQSGNLQISATLSNPPPSDLCGGAVSLNSNVTNGSTYALDTTYATETSDVADGCAASVAHGVWFTVTPGINQRVILSTAGSSFPAQMAIYTGSCGALASFTCVSPGYFNGQAGISFASASNVTYHILAGGYLGQSAQSGNLQISATLSNPPPNDICDSFVTLTNGVPFVENTTYATELGDATVGCGIGIGHGVWFTLAAFGGQQVTISTCGSSYATDLLVYTNACSAFETPYTCSSGSNPFNCAGNLAGLSFIAPTNLTCYILVSGAGSAYGILNITANQPPPTNDVCSGAIQMLPGTTYFTNSIYASSIGDPVPSCVPSFGRGIWYRYAPSVSGQVGITTCGSSFQTALAVYTGSCGALTEVACSQNSGAYCASGRADINFNGIAGTNYYVLAGGVNGAAGNLQIQIPVVDLVSTGLTAANPAGGLLTAGRNFAAGWAVQNQGTNSIFGTWTDQLTLSNAVTNIVIAQFSGLHNAAVGGSYVNTNGGTWNLGAIPAGNYTLIAQADTGNAVAEANKTNNIQTLSVTVTNIPPTVTLLLPTNQILRESCVAVPFTLFAQTVPGSYTVTNLIFYDNGTAVIGQDTNAPYVTTSLALNLGTHTITAKAFDNFNLNGASTNSATITLQYPTNLNILRVDLDTNGNFVGCMCAYQGSNYVIQTSTNLQPFPVWLPYSTNVAVTNIIAFTNRPTDKARFFRALRSP